MMSPRLLLILAAWLACGQAASASAAGFAAMVSPPRFELSARAAGSLRQVISITNGGSSSANYHLKTAEFRIGEDYGVTFQDALTADSCRPWVALERAVVPLAPGATVRYRFEVHVPPDAPQGECRFAIMIEGDEPSLAKAGAVQLPVVGRIGVIVYVTVGDAAPQIEVFGPAIVNHNGQQVPALRVHNAGNAHTRMSGFLSGKDATGRTYDFTPSDLPILPGEVREVLLTPSTPEDANPNLTFPVSVQGTLEWANQSIPLDERFK
jgi:fimbrial chaperone protein